MRDGGRIAAAIAVLVDMQARHKPVHLALKAWGDSARYAGAKDRAFVSGLALDILRRRRSLAWRMGEDSDRALALAAVRWLWGWDVARIDAAAGDPHGPAALSEAERTRLEGAGDLADAPAPVRGDYPDWLDGPLTRVFGEARAEELAALAARAPVDLRVNRLKSDREHVLKALSALNAEPVEAVANAIRLPPPAPAERTAAVEAAPAFEHGAFEVQDLGSQIAALCAGEVAHQQVLDLCAGGGGKTLALAAAMANTGQLYAYDADPRRLRDTTVRGHRAGVRNLQVRSPLQADVLADLTGRMDLVFVDAPCTGSGTWRRHPDAKWRLTGRQLATRMGEQDTVLDQAGAFVKRGGRIVYVTCSLLAEENEDRVAAFLGRHGDFAIGEIPDVPLRRVTAEGFLRLTPLSAGTDGFFAAVLRRR